MPIYRMTFGFSGGQQGWSETLAIKNPNVDPNSLKPLAQNLAQKRVTFLGREFQINVVRIARYSDDAGTTRQRGVALLKQVFTNPKQTVDQAAEPADVALLANGTTSADLGAGADYLGNKNQLFLGAPPDPAVDNAGQVFPGKSQLGVNVTSWATAVIQNGGGWLADARVTPLPIGVISQNVNGTVLFTMQNPIVAPYVQGQFYYARASGINLGRSAINGQLIVQASGANTFASKEIIGIALAQEGGQLRVYRQVKLFLAYNTLQIQLVVANHKRGRPFGSPRGRAPRRIRG